jgi:hypothetical protein
MSQQQKLVSQRRQKRPSLDALAGVTLFLDVILAGLFIVTIIQNRSNLKPGEPREGVLLILDLGLVMVCCVGSGIATVTQARRLGTILHTLVALGLLGMGSFILLSLLQGSGSYGGVPWEGLMIAAGLLGFAGLYGWLASRGLKSP